MANGIYDDKIFPIQRGGQAPAVTQQGITPINRSGMTGTSTPVRAPGTTPVRQPVSGITPPAGRDPNLPYSPNPMQTFWGALQKLGTTIGEGYAKMEQKGRMPIQQRLAEKGQAQRPVSGAPARPPAAGITDQQFGEEIAKQAQFQRTTPSVAGTKELRAVTPMGIGGDQVFRFDVPPEQQAEYGKAIFSGRPEGATPMGIDRDIERFGETPMSMAGIGDEQRRWAEEYFAGERAKNERMKRAQARGAERDLARDRAEAMVRFYRIPDEDAPQFIMDYVASETGGRGGIEAAEAERARAGAERETGLARAAAETTKAGIEAQREFQPVTLTEYDEMGQKTGQRVVPFSEFTGQVPSVRAPKPPSLDTLVRGMPKDVRDRIAKMQAAGTTDEQIVAALQQGGLI